VGKTLRTLRSKIIVLTLLVVLGTQAATVAAVLVAASRDINKRAYESIEAGSDVFKKVVANRGELLRQVIEPLSIDKDFRRYVENNNVKLITAELGQRVAWINADIAFVLNPAGETIAMNGDVLPQQANLGKLIQAGRSSIALDDKYYEMISVPMLSTATDSAQTTDSNNTTGEPVGWLSIGFAIDDGLAQKLASVTGLETTLMAQDSQRKISLLGSSLSREKRSLITKTSQKIANGLDPKKAAELMDVEYLSKHVLYIPNKRELFVVLQQPMTEAMAPFAALRGTLIHAATTALLFSLIMAFFLSRNITQPIRSLLLAARRMRVGNYDRKLEIDSQDEFGELANAFNAMREGIAERENHIMLQAQFDSLTGLPNRNQAMELLRSSLRVGAKTGHPVTIMVMHLQRFREIQSSLGHEIGDEVLRQVAIRMRPLLDDAQILARLEGDQFLIIAPNSDKKAGKETAQKLAELLDSGLSVQSVNVTLDACIGLCVFPEHGRQPDELLRRAAVAKNDAQQSQRKIRIYQNGREARHVRQLAILGDLRRATQENELKLFLQPKITLSDTTVCGAEALLRWDHPELGEIPPHEFIPLAESAGNIGIVTDWVLDRAVKQCAEWHKLDIDLPIAVNLSRRDLMNKKLPAMIQQKLDTHNVKAHSIVLEITEEAVVDDIDQAIETLEALRAMGMSISMDDFGTGYSSLGHLQKLPVDELKIDRAFITNLPEERQNAAIVRSIIELAHNLALEVVAEGVETTAALRWLREEGCERAQGFYLSKPMPAAKFEAWLRDWERLANEADDDSNHGDSLILRPRLIT
jgi:diguanylate cyclase (GGDEF)-like protein